MATARAFVNFDVYVKVNNAFTYVGSGTGSGTETVGSTGRVVVGWQGNFTFNSNNFTEVRVNITGGDNNTTNIATNRISMAWNVLNSTSDRTASPNGEKVVVTMRPS